jgi:hypothetical protein
MMFLPKDLLMVPLSGLYHITHKDGKLVDDFTSRAVTKNLNVLGIYSTR